MLDNQQITELSVNEIGARLANAEWERANFKVQADHYYKEVQRLQKELEELKAKYPEEHQESTPTVDNPPLVSEG